MLKEQGFTVPVRVCDDCYVDVLNRKMLFVPADNNSGSGTTTNNNDRIARPQHQRIS